MKPQDTVAGGEEEYNAFFYSLVSTDTQVLILLERLKETSLKMTPEIRLSLLTMLVIMSEILLEWDLIFLVHMPNPLRCNSNKIKFSAVLAAAGLIACHASKRFPDEQWEKYAVVTLMDCRSALDPVLSSHHISASLIKNDF
ncbi:uncharacterized protein LOC131006582 isoform X12 [Salvia miltiorrhiza]|uniref:uncharacterized protein LOC131006582 isoform X12 n=1 Tax=Salvia miltiorrhiza TaxID=226208 RepID=UPI0025AD07CC|nr:uncharacterized protein LOC131006582 isoform X12 [Salvia miltiorrhiza]